LFSVDFKIEPEIGLKIAIRLNFLMYLNTGS